MFTLPSKCSASSERPIASCLLLMSPENSFGQCEPGSIESSLLFPLLLLFPSVNMNDMHIGLHINNCYLSIKSIQSMC